MQQAAEVHGEAGARLHGLLVRPVQEVQGALTLEINLLDAS